MFLSLAPGQPFRAAVGPSMDEARAGHLLSRRHQFSQSRSAWPMDLLVGREPRCIPR